MSSHTCAISVSHRNSRNSFKTNRTSKFAIIRSNIRAPILPVKCLPYDRVGPKVLTRSLRTVSKVFAKEKSNSDHQNSTRCNPVSNLCNFAMASVNEMVSSVQGKLQPSTSFVKGMSALVLSVTLASPAALAGSLPLTDLPPLPTSFPPLPEVGVPNYTQMDLPNGLKVFLLEDHDRALVSGRLIMKGGTRGEEPDKVGAATLTATVQRAGGAEKLPGPKLDNALDDLAASIEVGAGSNSISISFSGLSEDKAKLMKYFEAVATKPLFPEDKLELRKIQFVDAIQHRNDNPSQVARRELNKILYGADSVFAREPVIPVIKSMTRDDLVNYYNKWERPDNAVLGICGDFKTEEMKSLVADTFGKWEVMADQPSTPPPLPNTPAKDLPSPLPTIWLVDRPGATQAAVAMGELGTQIGDPDTYALDALNGILNGFAGDLFNEVRSKEGLAYSVSGAFSEGLDHPGTFLLQGETAVPPKFIRAVRSVLNGSVLAPPTESQLQRAKDQALNSFVFNFANSEAQLNRIIAYKLFDLPDDYLFQYKEGLQKTTPSDVFNASKRRLHPNNQQVVVVADAASTQIRYFREFKELSVGVEFLPVD